MDEDQLLLRPTKPPPAGITEGEYQRAEDMAFIKAKLADMAFIKAKLAQLRREMGLFSIILGGAALVIL